MGGLGVLRFYGMWKGENRAGGGQFLPTPAVWKWWVPACWPVAFLTRSFHRC